MWASTSADKARDALWQEIRRESCISEQAARNIVSDWRVTFRIESDTTRSSNAPSRRYKRWMSEETREKLRRRKLGVKRSDAARLAVSLGHLGKKRGPFPATWKRAISEGRLRQIRLNRNVLNAMRCPINNLNECTASPLTGDLLPSIITEMDCSRLRALTKHYETP